MNRSRRRGHFTPRTFFLIPLASVLLAGAPVDANASMAGCQDMSERGYHPGAIRQCSGVIDDAGARASVKAQARFFRANSYYSTGDHEAALADIEAIIAGGGADGRAYALRGFIRLANEQVRGAEEDLTRAIELGQTEVQVYRQRADARLLLDDQAGAAEDLETVIGSDGRDAVALTQLALARNALGDTAGAREAIARAIDANPSYAPAFGARAAIASAEGDVEAALADYTRARNVAPGSTAYRLGRAGILFTAGNPEVALGEVNAVLEAYPDLTEALELRANIHQELGLFAEALADLDAIGSGGTPLWRGRLAMNSAQFERAEREYSDAIEADPKSAVSYLERGQARARLGQFADAASDFTSALENDLTLAERGALQLRGMARFEAGDIAGAALDFAAESIHVPDAPRPLIWQARAYSELGDLEAAEKAARRLVEVEPDTARAHAVLGDVLLRKGDIAGGRAQHEQALTVDPGYEQSRLRLEQIDQAG